jgi:hypothetical protein
VFTILLLFQAHSPHSHEQNKRYRGGDVKKDCCNDQALRCYCWRLGQNGAVSSSSVPTTRNIPCIYQGSARYIPKQFHMLGVYLVCTWYILLRCLHTLEYIWYIPQAGIYLGLVPEASDETLQAFSYSKMKLYEHAMTHKWTTDELPSSRRSS